MITFKNISLEELKRKVKAFKELYDRAPAISVYGTFDAIAHQDGVFVTRDCDLFIEKNYVVIDTLIEGCVKCKLTDDTASPDEQLITLK